MLIARPKSRQSGFTLIELMIAVVILGILASFAIPNFRSWMQNTQIRNAAESIANGLQRARAEAVSRNTRVAFVLNADSSWNIGVVAPASAIASSSNEGAKDAAVNVLPAGATTITFNNLGGIVTPTNADGSAPISQVDLSAPDGSRNLRVTIGVGGNTRMCDPSLAPNSSPRAC